MQIMILIIEAFANLYSDFARTIVGRMSGRLVHAIDRPYPRVESGVKGLAFVEAASKSSASRTWENVADPL
jgi:hypothetical protein